MAANYSTEEKLKELDDFSKRSNQRSIWWVGTVFAFVSTGTVYGEGPLFWVMVGVTLTVGCRADIVHYEFHRYETRLTEKAVEEFHARKRGGS